MSLKRYPNGIDKPYFFQKEAAESFPKWLRIEEQRRTGFDYVIGDDRATLLFHHQSRLYRSQTRDQPRGLGIINPDYVLIDLDPFECPFEKIVEAALLVRAKLDLAELESFPKTTGGDGMHIFIPLAPKYSYEQVRSFAELIAALLSCARAAGSVHHSTCGVQKRQKNRVYFDWAQIAEGKTISAPYVARARIPERRYQRRWPGTK